MKPTLNILGVELHNLSRAELLAQMQSGVFFNPNVDVIMKLRRDAEFHKIFHQAEFRLCDSRILQFAAAFLGTPVKEKISGSDFFGEFCAHHASNPEIQIFLLGAGPGVADTARARINTRLGREVIIGSHSPSFGFERNEAESLQLIEMVRQSGATVLAVGVGAPKQEKWIMRYKSMLPGVHIFLAIGATIDFEAGNVQRAPGWISQLGVEWMYRLYKEPKRLWRRYIVDDPPFLWFLLLQRLGLDRFSREQSFGKARLP